MKKHNKNGLLALTFSCLATAQIPYSFADVQDTNSAPVDVKHKIIQLKKTTDQPTVIEIEEDGKMQVIMLTADEVANKALLADKLADLDPETRETVLSALNNSGPHPNSGMKMMKVRGHKNIDIEEIHMQHSSGNPKIHKEFVIIDAADELEFKGHLKGHHKAVVKLIEKGNFSKAELDEIRTALDAKY